MQLGRLYGFFGYGFRVLGIFYQDRLRKSARGWQQLVRCHRILQIRDLLFPGKGAEGVGNLLLQRHLLILRNFRQRLLRLCG